MISSKIFSERTVCVFLLLIPVLSACAAPPVTETVKIEPIKVVAPALPVEMIDSKISVLEDLLANNRVQEKDRAAAAFLISDYHKIKLLSQGEPSQDNYREIIQTLFSSLGQFDEKYLLSQGQSTDETYKKASNDLYLKKQGILKKYNSRDYKSVITECSELEKAFGKEAINAETGVLLAMALSKEGRLSEAITMGDRIIDEMEGRPDLIQVRAGLIEWLISAGRKEKALKEYQKLVEDMNESQSVFDRAGARVGSHSKKAADSGERLDKLLDEELNPDAERQYLERLNANRNEGIDAAIKLIEKEDYESAITMLDNMKTGGGSTPEIEKQKAIAVERIINRERNSAAKMFLTAKKTNDTKKKRDLLLSAQDILNGLIERYPSAESISRVKSNLDSVNGELDKLGK